MKPWDRIELEGHVRSLMNAHWQPAGYTVPSPTTYTQQYLWDSCFHAIIWAGLGNDRCLVELESLFERQHESGFLPHMGYDAHPSDSVEFWGIAGSSSITQPPMYGHALLELSLRGFEPSQDLLDRAVEGIRYLLERRVHPSGLLRIVHPWESGMDNSPRWDSWCESPWTEERWYRAKGELVQSFVCDAAGAAYENPAFDVGSVGFTALTLWNAEALSQLVGNGLFGTRLGELRKALRRHYDPVAHTFVDAGRPSGAAPTLDGLLPGLLLGFGDASEQLASSRAFGGRYGPTFVHRGHQSFDPDAYWRGSTWPQMTYLCGKLAGEPEPSVSRALRRGAQRSKLAEHWNADTGSGLGTIPLSWAGLAIL
ncbi:MAG: hypothetical protein ACC652_07075 [Acidimicrobiales bacterium]